LDRCWQEGRLLRGRALELESSPKLFRRAFDAMVLLFLGDGYSFEYFINLCPALTIRSRMGLDSNWLPTFLHGSTTPHLGTPNVRGQSPQEVLCDRGCGLEDSLHGLSCDNKYFDSIPTIMLVVYAIYPSVHSPLRMEAIRIPWGWWVAAVKRVKRVIVVYRRGMNFRVNYLNALLKLRHFHIQAACTTLHHNECFEDQPAAHLNSLLFPADLFLHFSYPWLLWIFWTNRAKYNARLGALLCCDGCFIFFLRSACSFSGKYGLAIYFSLHAASIFSWCSSA